MDRRQQATTSWVPWPAEVKVTANFSRCGNGQLSCLSQGRLRRTEHLAILPGSSIDGISSREAEYVLRADRRLRQQGHSMSVAVTHLAFMRWLHPMMLTNSTPMHDSPYSGNGVHGAHPVVPWHAFGNRLGFNSPYVCRKIACHVAALQLFSGETDFEHQNTLNRTEPNLGIEYWEGCTLEDLCRTQADTM